VLCWLTPYCLSWTQARKGQLEFDVDLCEKKLDRATKLIGTNDSGASHLRQPAALILYDPLATESGYLPCVSHALGGLGGEKTRWTAVAAQLGDDYTNLMGDVLLAAGYVAYLGPFTAPYRDDASRRWTALCGEQAIPCAKAFRWVEDRQDDRQIMSGQRLPIAHKEFGLPTPHENAWKPEPGAGSMLLSITLPDSCLGFVLILLLPPGCKLFWATQ
jgi:hypothetical protein